MAKKKRGRKLYGAAKLAHERKLRGGGKSKRKSGAKGSGKGFGSRLTALEHKVSDHGRRIGHLEQTAKAVRKKLGMIYGGTSKRRRAS